MFWNLLKLTSEHVHENVACLVAETSSPQSFLHMLKSSHNTSVVHHLYSYELYFSMVFLTFSVCEGVLGLSILVSMIRTHGNDFFQSFVILQC